MSKSMKKKLQAKRKKEAAKKVRNDVKNSTSRIPDLNTHDGRVRGKAKYNRHRVAF